MKFNKIQFIGISIFFSLVVIGLMRNWIGNVLPLSPRDENIPELSYAWNLYYSAQKGVLFTGWNPLQIGGATNILQRGYWVLIPVVATSFITSISIDTVYKFFVGFLFVLSGVGMTMFLRQARVSLIGALVGGFAYMLAPPHLAIAIEGFEFNVYWMLIPWIMYCVEHFIATGAVFTNAVRLGILTAIALPAGNTLFVSSMPLFGLYIIVRLLLAQVTQKLKFVILSVSFFIILSAWLTLPSIIETKYSWIMVESTRKQVINLITPQQLVNLFAKRFTNHSVLAFDYKQNFTDMSWYLGTSTVILALCAFIIKNKRRDISISLLVLIFIMTPGFLIKLGILKSFAAEVLKFIPQLQAAYDHTFRLFILPTFGLTALAGIGTETILKLISKKKRITLTVLIIGFVLWDFSPYHAFFKSIPKYPLEKDGSIIKRMNTNLSQVRYWAPFPFVKHLPKYMHEYMTRYTYRNRINSSFLYIPYSPRYTSEIYDFILADALEPQKFDARFLSTVLDWGNVGYIILRPEIADYSNVIEELKKYDFESTYTSNTLIILERKNTDQFVRFTTSVVSIPTDKKEDLLYWYAVALQNKTPFYADKPVGEMLENSLNTNPVFEWDRPSYKQITIHANTRQPTLVSISESFYPGWHVTIDNQKANLLRVDYAFMGTYLPSGIHTIQFQYNQPWYYKAGLLISITGIIFAVFVINKTVELK